MNKQTQNLLSTFIVCSLALVTAIPVLPSFQSVHGYITSEREQLNKSARRRSRLHKNSDAKGRRITRYWKDKDLQYEKRKQTVRRTLKDTYIQGLKEENSLGASTTISNEKRKTVRMRDKAITREKYVRRAKRRAERLSRQSSQSSSTQ